MPRRSDNLCAQYGDAKTLIAKECPRHKTKTKKSCIKGLLKQIHPDKNDDPRCRILTDQLIEYLKTPQLQEEFNEVPVPVPVAVPRTLEWNGYNDEMYCSTDAMVQHEKTCYMAAACTVAYRLIDNNHRFQFRVNDKMSLVVISFLKEMKVSMSSCTQAPSEIQKAYSILKESGLFKFTKFEFIAVDRNVLKNTERTTAQLTDGGDEILFFVTLMALYGLRVHYGPLQTVDFSSINEDELVVLHYKCNIPLTSVPMEINKISNTMHLNLQAVLIHLKGDEDDHAICAFPCRDHLIFCNSWGEGCTRLIDMKESLRKKYNNVVKINFVCSGLKRTRKKSAPHFEENPLVFQTRRLRRHLSARDFWGIGTDNGLLQPLKSSDYKMFRELLPSLRNHLGKDVVVRKRWSQKFNDYAYDVIYKTNTGGHVIESYRESAFQQRALPRTNPLSGITNKFLGGSLPAAEEARRLWKQFNKTSQNDGPWYRDLTMECDPVRVVLACLQLGNYRDLFMKEGFSGQPGLLNLLNEDEKLFSFDDEERASFALLKSKLALGDLKKLQSWANRVRQVVENKGYLDDSPEKDRMLTQRGFQIALLADVFLKGEPTPLLVGDDFVIGSHYIVFSIRIDATYSARIRKAKVKELASRLGRLDPGNVRFVFADP